MRPPKLLETYADRKMAVLLGLGVSAGVPYMLTGRTLRLWARDEGVDLKTIGMIGLITLPYAYKFLWAPLFDWLTPLRLGRRRGWLLITQILLALSIVGLAFSGPESGEVGGVFIAAAVGVTFLGASQDVVADAYRTDILHHRDLGAGASIFTSGYRIAMLATGAGAVALASQISWTAVYIVAAAMVGAGVIATLVANEPKIDRPPESIESAVVGPIREFIVRNGRRAALIVLFIFAFKLPDSMAAAMIDPMLLDIGFTKQSISLWSLGVGTAVTIPGALIGGTIVTKIGLSRSLLVFGIAQALSNAGYLGLALLNKPDQPAMIAAVGIEYFCTGLVAAGFIAFLMSQCNERFSATQYALLSSVMGLSNSLGGATSGFVAESVGYSVFFFITMLVAVPGIAMLPWIGRSSRMPTAHCRVCGHALQVDARCVECGSVATSPDAAARSSA